jgi:hypothetical protein
VIPVVILREAKENGGVRHIDKAPVDGIGGCRAGTAFGF